MMPGFVGEPPPDSTTEVPPTGQSLLDAVIVKPVTWPGKKGDPFSGGLREKSGTMLESKNVVP